MVKILSRDSINRMVGRKSSVAGVGGGGGDVDLSGYATKIWTQETFVSIDFFRSLFRAYDSQNHEILPNDTDSTIDNIKAMFGFWTEQYLSALGQGTGGGGGGVGDVTWDLLANNSDTRQIALSHLTTALSGYALTSQLPTKVSQLTNDSGFITSLGDCFRYQGLVTNDYVTGTTYSTITNGSYRRQLSGSSDSLLHFQIGGSASGLDIRFSYPQDNTNPLQYRKCIDSNRFAGGWVTLIDSLNIGSQSVSYATSAGNASTVGGYGEGSFLHRSGGTMTGAITMKANQYTGNYAIDMNNSDIVNANAIYTSDLSDSWDEGIEFKRTNGYYDSFRAADGTFYFGVNSGTEKDGANLGSASANLGYVYTNHIHPGNRTGSR